MQTKWWDIKKPKQKNTTQKRITEDCYAYQIRRWLSQVPHGGIVGKTAVLIVYNESIPKETYILKERV